MGFGFNFIFILVPLTGLLLIGWLLTRHKLYGIVLGVIWFLIFGLIALSLTIQFLTGKKELKKKDYYGQYIINRDYFSGKQSDWQYNNFRFEIKENDSIYFYVTNKQKILKIYRGSITTSQPYRSERLIINMENPIHHITASNPTTYRSAWSFYVVLHSTRFNNVYFKKGYWKPID